MFKRLCKPLKTNSFFLFGARGTGKSTLLQDIIPTNSKWFDLLDEELFDQLVRSPKMIEEACSEGHDWIVIDEVQRIPKLLNLVHQMIEKKKQKFALTGSSARKLKRGSANLLAGRAFVNQLFPLTQVELGSKYKLTDLLHWGTLPKIFSLESASEKKAYLRSYGLTYIKEEIQAEQVVRKLEPFREFLTVSAQLAGKVLNYSSIAREVGATVPTVQTYFQILEETYIGFLLPHFHRSVRKSQTSSPKFYFFDNGVKKALEGSLDSSPTPGTSVFGELFEAFVIQEIFRLNQYFDKDFRLSYFRTKAGVEVDLILTKARRTILVEIKSADSIDEVAIEALARTAKVFGTNTSTYFVSRCNQKRDISGVRCMNYTEFFDRFAELS